MRNIIILSSLIISFNLSSQISEVDKEELKQGQWKDFYDDGSIKYNGQFINGVEQGLWKFYYQSGELKATKEFFHNGSAAATHIYYKNGNTTVVLQTPNASHLPSPNSSAPCELFEMTQRNR